MANCTSCEPTENMEAELVSDSIHCASCVNLIEVGLRGVVGIEHVRVNLTKKRISVRWKASKISLEEIIGKLKEIGHESFEYEPVEEEIEIKKKNRGLIYRIGFAGFAMMNMMWITISMYSGASEGEYSRFFEIIGLVLATPTLLYSGWPFIEGSVKNLIKGQLSMDLPITIGAVATYVYSIYVMVSGVGEVFFDTVVNFIFIILLGRYLESRARENALSQTNNLKKIEPHMVEITRDGKKYRVGVGEIIIGDSINVMPGDIIPIDGIVNYGKSGVDESIISGESVPVYKLVGDKVISGSISVTGNIDITATKLYRESTLFNIINMTENIEPGGNKIITKTDKVIPYFIIGTLGVAIFSFFFWVGVDIEFAILSSVSVLIITCPCALGLASPMAVAVAGGVGASKKILFKKGDALERLSEVNKIVFDKTGTLTNGDFKIEKIYSLIDDSEILKLMASIEALSEHPISKSIVSEWGGELYQVDEFESVVGMGVNGIIGEKKYLVGSKDWVETVDNLVDSGGILKKESTGYTAVYCVEMNVVIGMILIGDSIKEDARENINKLHELGYNICLASGDNKDVVIRVASELNIKEYYHSKKPEDKLDLINAMQEENRVMMVGDGINDAPALKTALVSMSYSTGYDLASKNSDVVSLSGSVGSVVEALNLGNKTTNTIKQNIYWAIAYNVVMVPMAVMGLVTPLFASIAMPISSIVVILNAGAIRIKK